MNITLPQLRQIIKEELQQPITGTVEKDPFAKKDPFALDKYNQGEDPEGEKLKQEFFDEMRKYYLKKRQRITDKFLQDLWLEHGQKWLADREKGRNLFGGPETRKKVWKEVHELIAEIIRKSGKNWCLYTKHKKGGKRRKLGTHSSKASAEKQERAIHAHGG